MPKASIRDRSRINPAQRKSRPGRKKTRIPVKIIRSSTPKTEFNGKKFKNKKIFVKRKHDDSNKKTELYEAEKLTILRELFLSSFKKPKIVFTFK